MPCPASPLLQNADKGDLVETFSKVMGVFVHYTDEQVSVGCRAGVGWPAGWAGGHSSCPGTLLLPRPATLSAHSPALLPATDHQLSAASLPCLPLTHAYTPCPACRRWTPL